MLGARRSMPACRRGEGQNERTSGSDLSEAKRRREDAKTSVPLEQRRRRRGEGTGTHGLAHPALRHSILPIFFLLVLFSILLLSVNIHLAPLPLSTLRLPTTRGLLLLCSRSGRRGRTDSFGDARLGLEDIVDVREDTALDDAHESGGEEKEEE